MYMYFSNHYHIVHPTGVHAGLMYMYHHIAHPTGVQAGLMYHHIAHPIGIQAGTPDCADDMNNHCKVDHMLWLLTQ